MKHVTDSDLNEPLRWSLTKTISVYYTFTAKATSEQLAQGIATVFKGQEYIRMIEEIKDSYILEGIEIGEARGEARGQLKEKVKDIFTVLQTRCGLVPSTISDELSRRTDLVALQSLLILAAQCKTLDEFSNALK